jgi:hypothetical protein
MAKKQSQKRRRPPLLEEIANNEALNPRGNVNKSFSIIRRLYLHALYRMRDKPYVSFSAYISSLISQDEEKHGEHPVNPDHGGDEH